MFGKVIDLCGLWLRVNGFLFYGVVVLCVCELLLNVLMEVEKKKRWELLILG